MSTARADIRGTKALALHRHLFRLALSAGNIFAWIFVFRAFYVANNDAALSLVGVAVLYGLSQVITIILTPLSGSALRYGIRRALVYGTLAAAFAFLCITLLFADSANLFWMISSFAILMGIHRALYWMPYRSAESSMHALHTPFALAREISVALMPLLAGAAIEAGPFGALFVFAGVAFAMALSLIPVAVREENFERFEWSAGETFGILFSRAYRSFFALAVLDGIQGVTLLLVWPLAVFLILEQSFTALGVVVSATLLLSLLLRGSVRRLFARLRLDRSRGVLAVIVFSSWILRLSAGSFLQILLVDVYHQTGSSPRRHGLDMRAADQAADAGHFVDEYTALKEMGMAIGRLITCVVFALAAFVYAAPTAFALCIILAAVAGAIGVLYSHRVAPSVY